MAIANASFGMGDEPLCCGVQILCRQWLGSPRMKRSLSWQWSIRVPVSRGVSSLPLKEQVVDRVCIAYGKLDGEVYEVRSPRLWRISRRKILPFGNQWPGSTALLLHRQGKGTTLQTPEVLLGVLQTHREEIQREAHGPNHAKDGTPSLQERLSSRKHIDPVDEGFDADNIQNQLTQARTADPEEIAPEERAATARRETNLS